MLNFLKFFHEYIENKKFSLVYEFNIKYWINSGIPSYKICEFRTQNSISWKHKNTSAYKNGKPEALVKIRFILTGPRWITYIISARRVPLRQAYS